MRKQKIIKTKKRTRLFPDDRKIQLLKVGTEIAKRIGLLKVNHTIIAKEAHASTALVFRYFSTRQVLEANLVDYILQHTEPSLVRIEAEIIRIRETGKTETNRVNKLLQESEFTLVEHKTQSA